MGAGTAPGLTRLHYMDHVLLGSRESVWPLLRPDQVILVGGSFVSKRLGQFLDWAAAGDGERYVPYMRACVGLCEQNVLVYWAGMPASLPSFVHLMARMGCCSWQGTLFLQQVPSFFCELLVWDTNIGICHSRSRLRLAQCPAGAAISWRGLQPRQLPSRCSTGTEGGAMVAQPTRHPHLFSLMLGVSMKLPNASALPSMAPCLGCSQCAVAAGTHTTHACLLARPARPTPIHTPQQYLWLTPCWYEAAKK